ncbi:MAG: hypothetical protein IJD40_09200 [Lachnospiraceae bacterium]|nr:hypothetical protein [Lachnospiraceae bacterium]
MDSMDKKEMQNFIDLCVRDGKSELQTWRDFRKVLGLKFEPNEKITEENEK